MCSVLTLEQLSGVMMMFEEGRFVFSMVLILTITDECQYSMLWSSSIQFPSLGSSPEIVGIQNKLSLKAKSRMF